MSTKTKKFLLLGFLVGCSGNPLAAKLPLPHFCSVAFSYPPALAQATGSGVTYSGEGSAATCEVINPHDISIQSGDFAFVLTAQQVSIVDERAGVNCTATQGVNVEQGSATFNLRCDDGSAVIGSVIYTR